MTDLNAYRSNRQLSCSQTIEGHLFDEAYCLHPLWPSHHMTEPVSEAAALAIVFDRLNTEVDAAKRNPDKPPCPITMLRVYIREDLRAAGLTEYADKLDARILRLR